MAVTLVLEQIALPVTGVVKLQLDYTFDLKISAVEARRRVHRWLVGEVSYMIRAGEPSMVIGKTAAEDFRVYWRVPALLTATHLGDVGVVGYVDVAVTTGELDEPEQTATQILQAAERIAASMPPYVPAAEVPSGFLATDLKPTISAPNGNPRAILQQFN